MTFPPGNSLHSITDAIRRCQDALHLSARHLGDGMGDGMAEPPRDVQGSPYVARNNLNNLRAAINNVPREILAEALADMLAYRVGKARASLILRDAAEIVETRK